MDLVELTPQPLERRHPWEEARFAFFLGVLARAGLPARGTPVLDVGSGDAWFASRLSAETGAELVCWDPAYAAGPPPAPPGVRLTPEAPEARFPLVLALDVFEHVTDDGELVARIASDRLAAGGHLLVSVPAWPALFSRHDEALRHVRRYAPRAARRLLERAGLRVVACGGLFHTLVLPRAAQKAVERLGGRRPRLAGEWRAPRWASALVEALLAVDARGSVLFSRLGLDVPGLSWWALCRRP